MLAFVIRRLLQGILVMLVVGSLAFAMFQFVGDPIESMLGEQATREQRDNDWGSMTRFSSSSVVSSSMLAMGTLASPIETSARSPI